MTVGEFKELLEDLDDEMEVQLQTQKHWPFINSISHVILKSQVYAQHDDEDKEFEKEGEDILFLVEGEQLSYGNKEAWNR